MIQTIVIKNEKGIEYAIKPRRIFQSEKDKIDQSLFEVVEETKYQDKFNIYLKAVAKNCDVQKLIKVEKPKKDEPAERREPVDALTEFAEFTIDNETTVTAAFNYFINSQSATFRFLAE